MGTDPGPVAVPVRDVLRGQLPWVGRLVRGYRPLVNLPAERVLMVLRPLVAGVAGVLRARVGQFLAEFFELVLLPPLQAELLPQLLEDSREVSREDAVLSGQFVGERVGRLVACRARCRIDGAPIGTNTRTAATHRLESQVGDDNKEDGTNRDDRVALVLPVPPLSVVRDVVDMLTDAHVLPSLVDAEVVKHPPEPR